MAGRPGARGAGSGLRAPRRWEGEAREQVTAPRGQVPQPGPEACGGGLRVQTPGLEEALGPTGLAAATEIHILQNMGKNESREPSSQTYAAFSAGL